MVYGDRSRISTGRSGGDHGAAVCVVTGHTTEQPAHFDIALARRYLRQRAAFRQASAVRDGPWYRTGPLKYQAGTEAARWSVTSEIIERVSPGPYEDPTFFELLARQAASLELGLSQSVDKKGPVWATSEEK